jgi:CDP-glycerol glycerophosphotransferase (TagB/SpsB family)
MIYMKAAKLLISSDTKAHAYAWHSPQSVYRTLLKNNRNVFLQHGVIYYKQCHRGLRKNGTNSCRLFIVSSEVEKKIVMDYFGYNDNEVAVTGLARWDVLEDTSVKGEKMILVMPTWRSWLEEVTQEAFAESDYYRNYMALLNSAKLHAFLEEEQVELVFYIHPKFREYISAFATDCPRIRMIEFGTQPLNELLMKCNMMVTDYSSACWDVFYQGKPVLFYLFDFELYNQVQGSYVDMRTEAFGDTTTDMDELVALMRSYTQNGFAEKPEYAAMRETLLPYRDHNNCERTYLAIRKKFYSEAYEEMEEVAREDSQEEE